MYKNKLNKALDTVFENQSTNEPHQSHNTCTLGATFGAANLAHKKNMNKKSKPKKKKQLAPSTGVHHDA
jgi:hypothetical protein